MAKDVIKTPKVSIGFPIRNGGQYLAAALNSVLNQTEQDFEIIISDNGSNDGSREYLQATAASDERILYFRQEPPICAYDNFRFVLNQARGEYFMWAAHDDTRDLDIIEKLVGALELCPNAVLAFGDLNLVTPDMSEGRITSFPFKTDGMGKMKRLFNMSRLQCFHIYGVWRTHALRKVPYAYCAWWPDLPMMLSAAILGTFIHVSGTCFNYLELQKSNLDRIKSQDYASRFNLLSGVLGLVAASYRACARVGGPVIGTYAAVLVTFKQIMNLPGYLSRRLTRVLS